MFLDKMFETQNDKFEKVLLGLRFKVFSAGFNILLAKRIQHIFHFLIAMGLP